MPEFMESPTFHLIVQNTLYCKSVSNAIVFELNTEINAEI